MKSENLQSVDYCGDQIIAKENITCPNLEC